MVSNCNIVYKIVSRKELSIEENRCVTGSEQALMNSYSPYSKLKVGAAALMSNGSLVLASNQENASFPVGICAERALVYSGEFTRNGVAKIIAISASKDGKYVDILPCGMCRQTLLEVEVRQRVKIVFIFKINSKFAIIESVSSLLPFAFHKF